MGLFHDSNPYSSKYITAEIKDSFKRLWFFHIIHTIGDYFLVNVDKQYYCFKIDNEICTYRQKLKKAFKVAQFDIRHYRPLKPVIKELELCLAENDLPKVDGMLSNILRVLGRREKKGSDFTPHKLADLIATISKYEESKVGKVVAKEDNRFAQQASSIINYLDNLNIREIVTPIRGISDYIEDDLKATDPKFLGTVASTLQSLEFENKLVMNQPISSKKEWIKYVLIIVIILVIALLIYHGTTAGWFKIFTDLGSGFQGISLPLPGSFVPPGSVTHDSNYYMTNFTPEELKAKVDRGELQMDQLPKDIQELIKNVQLPTVTSP